MPIAPRASLEMTHDSAREDSSWESNRGRDDRSGDRKQNPQSRKKKKSREARLAERARELLAQKKAKELAGATEGGASNEGGEGLRVVDGDRLPDGKLVKLSEAEQAKFKNVNLLTLGKAAAATATLGFLGYKYGKTAAYGYLGYKALPAIDGLARLLDRLGDKMMRTAKRHLPWPFKQIVGGTAGLLDWSAKKLGLDKTLYEYLKKDKEARKKLAEKLLKELRADEKKHESKIDAKAKKEKDKKERDRKRFARLAARWGPETAHMMVYEMDELDLELDEDDTKEDDKKDEGGEAQAAA